MHHNSKHTALHFFCPTSESGIIFTLFPVEIYPGRLVTQPADSANSAFTLGAIVSHSARLSALSARTPSLSVNYGPSKATLIFLARGTCTKSESGNEYKTDTLSVGRPAGRLCVILARTEWYNNFIRMQRRHTRIRERFYINIYTESIGYVCVKANELENAAAPDL